MDKKYYIVKHYCCSYCLIGYDTREEAIECFKSHDN